MAPSLGPAVPGATCGFCGAVAVALSARTDLSPCRPDEASWSNKVEKPAAARSRAGGRGLAMLLVDAVRALPSLGFERLDREASLFHRAYAAMKPRTVCRCHPNFNMISASVAPSSRWSIATTWAVLLPSRGPARFCAVAAFLPLGAFLTAVALLVAFAFLGATSGACAPALANCSLASGEAFASTWVGGGFNRRLVLTRYGVRNLVRAPGPPSPWNGFPNPLGGDLSVRELLNRYDSRQAVPNPDQPLAVVADRVGKLLLG